MVCDHCNAEGPKMQTRQEAIEAWNRISRIVDVHEKEEILRKAMAADMGIEYSYPIDGYIKK
jgi:deoxyxylulose-5-phosphate synthase